MYGSWGSLFVDDADLRASRAEDTARQGGHYETGDPPFSWSRVSWRRVFRLVYQSPGEIHAHREKVQATRNAERAAAWGARRPWVEGRWPGDGMAWIVPPHCEGEPTVAHIEAEGS